MVVVVWEERRKEEDGVCSGLNRQVCETSLRVNELICHSGSHELSE